MRLMEGKSQFEGRLEVCFNGRWSTFGSDGWTQINTQVICNSLGYDFSGKYVLYFMSILKLLCDVHMRIVLHVYVYM